MVTVLGRPGRGASHVGKNHHVQTGPPTFWRWHTMVHVPPNMFLSEWREFPSVPCLAKKKKNLTARVSMLLKSRASPDMLHFSLCNKKRLAIRHVNRRPFFPTTLSIPSYGIGKFFELRTYQHPDVLKANAGFAFIFNFEAVKWGKANDRSGSKFPQNHSRIFMELLYCFVCSCYPHLSETAWNIN